MHGPLSWIIDGIVLVLVIGWNVARDIIRHRKHTATMRRIRALREGLKGPDNTHVE